MPSKKMELLQEAREDLPRLFIQVVRKNQEQTVTSISREQFEFICLIPLPLKTSL